MILKILLLILCAVIIFFLFSTEFVLKKIFRCGEVSRGLEMKIKLILLAAATVLFIAVMIIK